MIYSFSTDDGVVVPTVSVAQMREVDRIAIENETPKLSQMMENAGRNLADAAMSHLGTEWVEVPITVLVGPGGNGGGGVAAARHLANRGGNVAVVVSRAQDLGAALEQQIAVYSETRGRLSDIVPGDTGLILDALIGYGLTDEPGGVIADLIHSVNESDAPVISLDVPTGLDGDTGYSPGAVIAATETLSLALPKPGLRAAIAGDIWLGDLGIPTGVYRSIDIDPSPRIFERGPLVHLNRRAPEPRQT